MASRRKYTSDICKYIGLAFMLPVIETIIKINSGEISISEISYHHYLVPFVISTTFLFIGGIILGGNKHNE